MTTQSMKFGHFGVNCFDIEKMENFYTHVVGMVVADCGYVPPPGDRHIVFMTLDPTEHHQLILCSGRTEGKIEKGPFRGGGRGSAINQISFHCATLGDLRRAKARLAAGRCRLQRRHADLPRQRMVDLHPRHRRQSAGDLCR